MSSQSAGPPGAPPDGNEFGPQVRPMGLKVHYSFDRENQVKCLARWSQTLQIQTVPLDEKTSIGVVDLRTCLQAVAQCSPEIINQHDNDYTVYAHDYSEPDVPLVGQGMLSWGLDPASDPQSQQLLTGRVTKNMLAIFGNGVRETLEVKLKLTAVAKVYRQANLPGTDQHMHRSMPTSAESHEWNSLLQANPTLGHSANVAPLQSPSLRSVQLNHPTADGRYPEPSAQQSMMHYPQQGQQPPSRPGSIPPRPSSIPPNHMSGSAQMHQGHDGPGGPPPPSDAGADKLAKSSRPGSRAGRRSRPPTGRPRGRPPKKAKDAGNTSAAEEATDADEAPQKKRAQVTKADFQHNVPFGSAPDSLRVAASTSGSLRNMRPIGSGVEMSVGGHLQEVPRAPTPVPESSLLQKPARRMAPAAASAMRRASTADIDRSNFSQLNRQTSMGMDARSPTDSMAHSPDQCYTPEESPADMGSSPPVARTGNFMRSSPAPSSPGLPPMSRVDSGFMSGGFEDVYDEEELQKEVTRQLQLQNGGDILGLPPLPPLNHPYPQQGNQAQRRSSKQGLARPLLPPSDYSFQVENPGPPELLPVNSIYNPPSLSRAAKQAPSKSRPKSRVGSTSAPSTSRPAVPELTRSNTAPPPTLANAEPHVGHARSPLSFDQNDVQARPLSQPCGPAPDVQSLQHSGPQPAQAPQGSQPFPLSQDQHGLQAPQASQPPQATQAPQVPEPSLSVYVPADPLASLQLAEETLLRRLGEDLAVTTPCESTVRASNPESGAQPLAESSAAGSAAQSLLSLPSLSAPLTDSQEPSILPVPASDPAPPATALSLPQAPVPQSEAACPPSDSEPCLSKNAVKKQSIKERLESAIQRGEMPPFCNNCGAIQTPTWRKIWTQEHEGIPPVHELSDKAGHVTTIDILERDTDGKPTKYRLVKKSLGPTDAKNAWRESLLCNPCGIWLAKFKGHRPSNRWDKDAARLNQSRRKRENKGGNSRSKRAKKADGTANPTSEAYFMTDPIGPADQESPDDGPQNMDDMLSQQSNLGYAGNNDQSQDGAHAYGLSVPSPKSKGPGSTHSRGSGTVDSPIALEEDDGMGITRRLLFPSPRKDGVPKVLGELAINMVQTSHDFEHLKSPATGHGKENDLELPARPTTPVADDDDDMLNGLFGTPADRPCTPPPKGNNGPFKTPTRPTPSHRPITRSISRSIRTGHSVIKSPSQALFERTPTKTPHSRLSDPRSASKRRTPGRTPGRNQQYLHAHFALGDDVGMDMAGVHMDSPFTATLNQLLSEADGFTADSPSHGLADLDLASLPNIDSDGVAPHLNGTALDFGSFLSTDMAMPSSPPLLRSSASLLSYNGSFGVNADIWAQFTGTATDKGDEESQ